MVLNCLVTRNVKTANLVLSSEPLIILIKKNNLLGDLAFTSAFQAHQGQVAWNCSYFSYSQKPHLSEGHKDGSPHNVR